MWNCGSYLSRNIVEGDQKDHLDVNYANFTEGYDDQASAIGTEEALSAF